MRDLFFVKKKTDTREDKKMGSSGFCVLFKNVFLQKVLQFPLIADMNSCWPSRVIIDAFNWLFDAFLAAILRLCRYRSCHVIRAARCFP